MTTPFGKLPVTWLHGRKPSSSVAYVPRANGVDAEEPEAEDEPRPKHSSEESEAEA